MHCSQFSHPVTKNTLKSDNSTGTGACIYLHFCRKYKRKTAWTDFESLFVYLTMLQTCFIILSPKNDNFNCILLVQRKIHLHVGVKKGSKYWSNYQQSRKKTSIELKRAPVNIWATVKMSTDLCPQAVELRSPAFWRGSWSRPGWAWSPSGPRWSVCPLTAPGSWGPAETPPHHPSPICLIHGSIIYTM